MLSPGDMIQIKTEGSTYVFVLTGGGFAALAGGSEEGREVRLLGCADAGGANISWGSIQPGGRLLFSDYGEDELATMTSPIQSILTRGTRTSGGGSAMTAMTPTVVARAATSPTPKIIGHPRVTPRIAIPKVRV